MSIFESASKPLAEYRDWDPRFPEVIQSLLSDIGSLPLGVGIEHVGSTAVPGCGGKGVIDLLALYADGGGIARTRYRLRRSPMIHEPACGASFEARLVLLVAHDDDFIEGVA